jgi:hypothetical protein
MFKTLSDLGLSCYIKILLRLEVLKHLTEFKIHHTCVFIWETWGVLVCPLWNSGWNLIPIAMVLQWQGL